MCFLAQGVLEREISSLRLQGGWAFSAEVASAMRRERVPCGTSLLVHMVQLILPNVCIKIQEQSQIQR